MLLAVAQSWSRYIVCIRPLFVEVAIHSSSHGYREMVQLEEQDQDDDDQA